MEAGVISQDLINSRLGMLLSRMGKPIRNAAAYKQELGINCPNDQEILDEDIKYLAEQELSKSASNAYNAGLSEGYLTSHGYRLSVGENSFKTMSAYIDWLKEMVSAGQYTSDTQLFLKDKDGNKHPETVGYIISLKLPYGAKCLEVESLAP
jgi:hypothetical protein